MIIALQQFRSGRPRYMGADAFNSVDETHAGGCLCGGCATASGANSEE